MKKAYSELLGFELKTFIHDVIENRMCCQYADYLMMISHANQPILSWLFGTVFCTYILYYIWGSKICTCSLQSDKRFDEPKIPLWDLASWLNKSLTTSWILFFRYYWNFGIDFLNPSKYRAPCSYEVAEPGFSNWICRVFFSAQEYNIVKVHNDKNAIKEIKQQLTVGSSCFFWIIRFLQLERGLKA